jgi:hypothetical protein
MSPTIPTTTNKRERCLIAVMGDEVRLQQKLISK